MLCLLTILTPGLKRSIDTCRLIIIINLGYHPADIIIIPVYLQRINIFKGWRLFDYYKKIAIIPPYLIKIGGRKNNLLFTLGTRGNNKLSPPMKPKNNKNRGTRIFFFNFYKILLFYIFNLIIYRTKGIDKNINKGADRKGNRNKTPRRREKDPGQKIWHKGVHQG